MRIVNYASSNHYIKKEIGLMAIEVREAREDDMPRIFEITSLAFQRNEPFWDAWWPQHWTADGRKAGAERFKQTMKDPFAKYMKAVDSSTGEILGMAKWMIYDNRLPEPDAAETGHWLSEDEEKYATYMAGIFLVERNAAIQRTKGNLVSLDVLAVDPAYQRKGVGHALVQWGVNKGDEMGVECVVESSVFGKGLYEKHGYVFVKDVALQTPPQWADRPVQEFAWLVRPKTVKT